MGGRQISAINTRRSAADSAKPAQTFDTVPACDGRTDGQTDGIAIASTALAMRALRRAVKTQETIRKIE